MSHNFTYPTDFDEYPDPRDYYDPKEALENSDAYRRILDYPEGGDELDFE